MQILLLLQEWVNIKQLCLKWLQFVLVLQQRLCLVVIAAAVAPISIRTRAVAAATVAGVAAPKKHEQAGDADSEREAQ